MQIFCKNICLYAEFIVILYRFLTYCQYTMVKRKDHSFGKPWELNPIWDILTPEQKLMIADEMEVVHYKKNEVIYHAGDHPANIMMLVVGKVRIYKEGNSQRQQIIRLLKPFNFFGFRAIITGDDHTSGASALEACVVYKLGRDAFLQLLRENNSFCYHMMLMIAEHLGSSEQQVVNLTQKHIRGRLAESLLNLIDNYGYDEDGSTIAMYMSREDLANMSNMTTSNAIRTLSQFAQEQLIAIDGRKIQVLNEQELKRISRLG